jgi:hypothetical protein
MGRGGEEQEARWGHTFVLLEEATTEGLTPGLRLGKMGETVSWSSSLPDERKSYGKKHQE